MCTPELAKKTLDSMSGQPLANMGIDAAVPDAAKVPGMKKPVFYRFETPGKQSFSRAFEAAPNGNQTIAPKGYYGGYATLQDWAKTLKAGGGAAKPAGAPPKLYSDVEYYGSNQTLPGWETHPSARADIAGMSADMSEFKPVSRRFSIGENGDLVDNASRMAVMNPAGLVLSRGFDPAPRDDYRSLIMRG